MALQQGTPSLNYCIYQQQEEPVPLYLLRVHGRESGDDVILMHQGKAVLLT